MAQVNSDGLLLLLLKTGDRFFLLLGRGSEKADLIELAFSVYILDFAAIVLLYIDRWA